MTCVDQLKKKNCTGCSACSNSCPQNAIVMIEDVEGFLYPEIDSAKCVECGLCVRRCPQIEKAAVNGNFKKPIVYAAWNKDQKIREESTSGGVFTVLAETILERGGYVAAVRYSDNHEIEHCVISKAEQIPLVRQSKYAQSRKKNIYRQVAQLLKTGREVLFCGTPCECAALLKVLNGKPDGLWLVDFICRGANSPKAYRCFLQYLEEKYCSRVVRVWFKNKTYGWNLFSTRVDFENGSYYIEDRFHDLFIDGYIHHNLYMRPSCADCVYKVFPHLSDITLADFWGVKLTDSSLDTDRGTSMVMVNSVKGTELFEIVKKDLFWEEKQFEDTLSGNPSILKSPVMSPKREYFFSHLGRVPFDKLMERCCRPNIKIRFKRFIKKILRMH